MLMKRRRLSETPLVQVRPEPVDIRELRKVPAHLLLSAPRLVDEYSLVEQRVRRRRRRRPSVVVLPSTLISSDTSESLRLDSLPCRRVASQHTTSNIAISTRISRSTSTRRLRPVSRRRVPWPAAASSTQAPPIALLNGACNLHRRDAALDARVDGAAILHARVAARPGGARGARRCKGGRLLATRRQERRGPGTHLRR